MLLHFNENNLKIIKILVPDITWCQNGGVWMETKYSGTAWS